MKVHFAEAVRSGTARAVTTEQAASPDSPHGQGVAVTADESTRKRFGPSPGLRLGLAVALAGLTGCGSGPHVVALSDSEKNLTHIAMAYGEAQSSLGHPPKNAEQLKPFLKEFGNPDELLVSPNDGQPYVVIWGADTTRGGPTEYKGMWGILAYEKKGANGKRAVTDIRGRPLTVPEADFAKLTFVGRHKPS